MSIESQIFNYLLKEGCCQACCIRYLRDRNVDCNDINGYIKKKLLTNGDAETESDCDLPTKKCKLNPCIVCLGLLQDSIIEDIVNKLLISEVQKYDTTTFTCSISIPAATLIREFAIRHLLQQNFAQFYINDIDEIPLNKMWKWIIKDKLSEKLQKKFENSGVCDFSINIVMDYEDNSKELSVLKKFASEKSKRNGAFCSRKSVVSILENVSLKEFEDVAEIPPKIPTNELVCKQIECKRNSIYIGGRYCKFSRNLSQTPWIIDGVKTMKTSVEEIIFEQINKAFDIPTTNLKFSASGREDCDVRCLGKGRPFYIEILDPKRTIFTFEEFRKLETNVEESTLITVRDLQIVQRAELANIKEGEQMKTKNYVALCRAKNPITREQIDKINKLGEITLRQKTPIRVLHRRPVAIRNKKIHEMTAELIPEYSNLFELRVVTEAGTYVKEFVHGDFGRTKPSVGDIVGDEVDIVALDVSSVNLDWPKEINVDTT